MIYWYTGQPGHGKTLNAIAFVIAMKKEADAKHAKDPGKHPKRELFICNVRDMEFDKVGATPLSPEEFKAWADSPEYLEKLASLEARRGNMTKDQYSEARKELESEKCATEEINPRFHNAIVLIDEAYEHGIFPKRPPSASVPRHVERVAKHRHYGMDIVGVCQSPDKQCDGFLHDLIEWHVHVRRRFGTSYQHLREFDRFEANPEKKAPLKIKRQMLPKHVFGLYKSTQLDTTERRIPWYFVAFAVGIPLGLGFMYYTFGGMKERLGGGVEPVPIASASAGANGAQAPVAPGASRKVETPLEFAQRFVPRIPSQPWSAPAYDNLQVSADPPRLFCMSSRRGTDAAGGIRRTSCSCVTEQGTRYTVRMDVCMAIARDGQYEPYYQERTQMQMDGLAMQDTHAQELRRLREGGATAQVVGVPQVPSYGDIAIKPNPGATNPGWGTVR